MTTVSILPIFRRRVFLCLLILSQGHAAFEYPGAGWASGTAHIQVVGQAQLDRSRFNPALMDSSQTGTIGLFHHRLFSGLDLVSTSLTCALPRDGNPLVMSLSIFGDEGYQELQVLSGDAWQLSPDFRVGTTISYSQVNMESETIHRELSLSPGMILKLSEELSLGSVLENVIYLPQDSVRAQVFHLGLDYHLPRIQLLAEIEKAGPLDLDLKLAIQLSLYQSLTLVMGYQQSSRALTGGWRLKVGRWAVYYTWMGHPFLPPSHGLGLDLDL